ncbi:unnamed protein product [Adineta ricciae]|uniref:Uncharacterized protein n=1 Tax=Adineta ricciae TaxID=249248 RepID=A0A814LHK6_ADIRI|nr:unnamed protein product [Adineta ricciae]
MGQFKDDRKNGQGAYYYANGNKYIGDWIDDSPPREGVFIWSSGDRYERCCSIVVNATMRGTHEQCWGRFKDGRKNGQGVCHYSNGNKYTGEWEHDKQTGQGTLIFSSGDRSNNNESYDIYERRLGRFERNKINGKGVFYYANGDKYIGDWIDDNREGQGVLILSSGDRIRDVYEQRLGQFKGHKINGKGIFYSANGDKYSGDWIDDKRTGYGVFTWSTGDRYETK